MNLGILQVWNPLARVRRRLGRKSSHGSRLRVENLEGRRLLAADMTALAGDLALGSVPAPPDPAAETVSVMEVNVPPITRNHSRASADIADGAQERPGEGWEASAVEAASTIVSPLAIDTAVAAEESDPPETRNHARVSSEESDGAHERPGEGWEASAAETASASVSPLAVDIAIAADDSDPPETQNRGRISDEVDDSDGWHKRPGRGWD